MFNYDFNDNNLLQQALTHRSLGNNNNERLEFLGDAVLGSVVAAALFRKFPEANEGDLTRLRAHLVKGERLAEIANQHGLQDMINLGPGELKSGGWRRQSVLANTLEAILGAIFLDSDFESCQRVILHLYQPYLETINIDDIQKDAKTRLQEYLQSRQLNTPVYKLISQTGSPHNPHFKVSCHVENLDQEIIAEGKSKRKAEQAAAEKALLMVTGDN